MERRCNRCVGSGFIMGGGMTHLDCVDCKGTGKIIEPDKVVLDKRSKSYRDAIDNIMALNPDYTREDAAKVFDAEFEKLEA